MTRLDKFVANNTGLPRKGACQLIKQGAVTCNGRPITQPANKVAATDIISVHGAPLVEPTHLYWMLHKSPGTVCANHDSEHPTVFDSIDTTTVHPALRHNLQIAGRLDRDTTGLVLITSDGNWNHAVTSPHKTVGKRYRVELADIITAEAKQLIEAGILLRNEKTPCKPAKLTLIDSNSCLLEIYEGKYHQVKRMFAATGNRVTQLHREAIASIELDNNLKPNQYRPLTLDEINSITK